jgi:hypothetical protein
VERKVLCRVALESVRNLTGSAVTLLVIVVVEVVSHPPTYRVHPRHESVCQQIGITSRRLYPSTVLVLYIDPSSSFSNPANTPHHGDSDRHETNETMSIPTRP